MGTSRGRRVVGALAVVAGALAGCTGSPSPGTSSSWPAVTTTSTTTSATPSSTTTTLDAQAALQAEAVEAVKKYYEAWNRALVSLDSKELKAMSLPTCEACAADLYDLEAFKTKGQTVQGGAITVSNLKALPGVESGIPVQGNAIRAPAKIFSKGVLVKSYSQDTAINRLWVVARSGGRLVMKGIS